MMASWSQESLVRPMQHTSLSSVFCLLFDRFIFSISQLHDLAIHYENQYILNYWICIGWNLRCMQGIVGTKSRWNQILLSMLWIYTGSPQDKQYTYTHRLARGQRVHIGRLNRGQTVHTYTQHTRGKPPHFSVKWLWISWIRIHFY